MPNIQRVGILSSTPTGRNLIIQPLHKTLQNTLAAMIDVLNFVRGVIYFEHLRDTNRMELVFLPVPDNFSTQPPSFTLIVGDVPAYIVRVKAIHWRRRGLFSNVWAHHEGAAGAAPPNQCFVRYFQQVVQHCFLGKVVQGSQNCAGVMKCWKS